MKPRVRFCWHCGNKLRGNHFTEIEFDGHSRILHKACAVELKAGGSARARMAEAGRDFQQNMKTRFR